MRQLLVALVLILGLAGASDAGRGRKSGGYGTGSKASSTSVRGYTTKRGTTVKSYRRTTSDRTQKNNYSTRGNRNPWTGTTGTKRAKR
jgi:hypothetical protein